MTHKSRRTGSNWLADQNRFARSSQSRRSKGCHGVSSKKHGIVACPHCGHHPLKAVQRQIPQKNDKGEITGVLMSKDVFCYGCNRVLKNISQEMRHLPPAPEAPAVVPTEAK